MEKNVKVLETKVAELAIVGTNRTPRGQLDKSGALSGQKLKAIKKSKEPSRVKQKSPRSAGEDSSLVFRRLYDRGDLPVALDSATRTQKLKWRYEVEVESLDYNHYLPVFFDGLREVQDPYGTIAELAVHSLLAAGGQKIPSVVPQLILPMKRALDSGNTMILRRTIKVFQHLTTSDPDVGLLLVPYFRQLLAPMIKYKAKNRNIGDSIDYSQRKEPLGDLIDETLNLLETHGGPDAFINIRYMVPTYESCLLFDK